MLTNQTITECLLLQILDDTSDSSNIQVYSIIPFFPVYLQVATYVDVPHRVAITTPGASIQF